MAKTRKLNGETPKKKKAQVYKPKRKEKKYLIKVVNKPQYFHAEDPKKPEELKFVIKEGIYGALLFDLDVAQDIVLRSKAANLDIVEYSPEKN